MNAASPAAIPPGGAQIRYPALQLFQRLCGRSSLALMERRIVPQHLELFLDAHLAPGLAFWPFWSSTNADPASNPGHRVDLDQKPSVSRQLTRRHHSFLPSYGQQVPTMNEHVHPMSAHDATAAEVVVNPAAQGKMGQPLWARTGLIATVIGLIALAAG
jgi:hypothetical protein